LEVGREQRIERAADAVLGNRALHQSELLRAFQVGVLHVPADARVDRHGAERKRGGKLQERIGGGGVDRSLVPVRERRAETFRAVFGRRQAFLV
jgi:hypothetical protein